MPELLLTLFAILLAAVALLGWLQSRRRHARLEQRLEELENQQHFIQQSISGLTVGALGMDKRMRRIEAQEKMLAERQETIENQQGNERPYSQAIRLVQQGAAASRLVEELGLSASEADLIVRLHGSPGGA